MAKKKSGHPGTARSGPGARLALAAGTVIAGFGALMAIPATPTAQSAGASVTAAAPAAPQAGSSQPGATDSPADPNAPSQLALPEFGVSAPVQPVTVADDGSLGIPDNPQVLGWWRNGSALGAPGGAIVIDGHVDSDLYGVGFFVNLRRLRDGDHVMLTDGSGATSRWRVVDYKRYPRQALPADQLFNTTGPLRLILITCGGEFDHASHSYPDNLVVLAVPDIGSTGTPTPTP